MKIVTIFDTEDYSRFGGLFSVEFFDDGVSEFERFFEQLNDIEWLFRFFIENQNDLRQFNSIISVDEAITKTLAEVQHIEDTLLNAFNEGITGKGIGLDQIFRPLNDNEYMITELQKSKTRANKYIVKSPWCRLYAVRLDKNLFIVTGGGIKLTKTMNESSHLRAELQKINKVHSFLKTRNIITGQDLNDYYESNEDYA